MPTQSAFPKPFEEFYAIHATITRWLSALNGAPVDVDQVAQKVREEHPELGMGPATLRAAIKQAIRSQGAQQR